MKKAVNVDSSKFMFLNKTESRQAWHCIDCNLKTPYYHFYCGVLKELRGASISDIIFKKEQICGIRKKEIQVQRWPLELAKQCRQSSPGGQIGRHWLAGNSKDHCGKYKFFFFRALYSYYVHDKEVLFF